MIVELGVVVYEKDWNKKFKITFWSRVCVFIAIQLIYIQFH